jgi:hypothetical protein
MTVQQLGGRNVREQLQKPKRLRRIISGKRRREAGD